LEIVTAGVMLNRTELDETPPCTTMTYPVVAVLETVATICVLAQLETVPSVLPNHTTPVPWFDPKPDPEIVTTTPAEPEVGVTLEMFGRGEIV
jgi:hypothetical protein